MHPPLDGTLLVTQLFGSTRADKPYTIPNGSTAIPVLGHTGIDLNCAVGTPVLAVWASRIIRAEWDTTGFGKCVELQTADGRRFLYGHLSAFRTVVGALVGPGEVIALSGATGKATGPHLHGEYLPANPDRYNGFRGTVDWIAGLDHQYVTRWDLSLV